MSTATIEEKATNAVSDFQKGFRAYQKQILEFQKSAFDSSFEAFTTFQEQQGQFVADMLERSENVPEEGKQLLTEWVDTFRRGREDYKAAIDKSYDLMLHYFERVETDSAE